MRIEILGPGCPKCERLAANASEAARDVDPAAEVVKVKDIGAITSRGILLTPALVVDGEVRSSGKVLSTEQIRALLRKEA